MTESNDDYLGPLAEMLKSDDSSDPGPPSNLPDDMPPEVKALVEQILGQNPGAAVRSAVIAIGPNGAQLVQDNTRSGIPPELIERLHGLNDEAKKSKPEWIGNALARLAEGLRAAESGNPADAMVQLGYSKEDANELMRVITEMTHSVGEDSFTEDAYRRLFTETDLFEQMIFSAGMFFCLGAYLERERTTQRDESTDPSVPSPTGTGEGDNGGSGEGRDPRSA